MTKTDLSSLMRHRSRLSALNLRAAFRDDPNRFQRFSVSLDDLTLDFSKELIDAPALAALFDIVAQTDVLGKRDAMAAGQAINSTESRAVMHMGLRAKTSDGFVVDGVPIAPIVQQEGDRLFAFVDGIRSSAISDVINIGIGGSDLGSVMATRALSPYRGDGPRVHFVSNVDGAHLRDVTANLNPATTLVIVVSKTFSTQETLANAQAARNWLGVEYVAKNMAAVSTNLEATNAFGIHPDHVFGFWDWVGGRYSIWSAVGLSLAIAIGTQHFRAFLDGARNMDRHFLSAPPAENLPILLALIGILRRNVLGFQTVALIPYAQRLERFAAYIQQLEMESNGKSTLHTGQASAVATAPVIWGEPGTNAQHSFFQLLHQGSDIIPVDFILTACPHSDLDAQHDMLLANCLAQSEALAFGKTSDELRVQMQAAGACEAEIATLLPHRSFTGNRPSTTILMRALTPFALGRLIALYEHKTFVQGAIWGINSFDQWGVELGKELANAVLPMIQGKIPADTKDSSTKALLERIAILK